MNKFKVGDKVQIVSKSIGGRMFINLSHNTGVGLQKYMRVRIRIMIIIIGVTAFSKC